MTDNKQRISTEEESTLWVAFLGGDESAFIKVVKVYSKPLFSYGHRLCQDRDFLKDCIQEVFVDIWNKREKIKVSPYVKWYLYKSLRNRIVRDLRKWSKNEMLDADYNFTVEFDIEHQLIANFAEKELVIKVKRAMDLLPPRQREVLYLRFFVGLQFDHIALVMDVTKQSTHNLLQKAYKSFRKEWNIGHMIAMYL